MSVSFYDEITQASAEKVKERAQHFHSVIVPELLDAMRARVAAGFRDYVFPVPRPHLMTMEECLQELKAIPSFDRFRISELSFNTVLIQWN